VNLGIILLFAFFNNSIILDKDILLTLSESTISLGNIFRLLLSKLLVIMEMTFACIKLNIGSLPEKLNMNNVVGIGLLAGMGFTMSLFIANLGLGHLSDQLVEAKLAILTATLLSGISGLAWLYVSSVKLEKSQ
jgi:NhaA family Na+:H+ antiporter